MKKILLLVAILMGPSLHSQFPPIRPRAHRLVQLSQTSMEDAIAVACIANGDMNDVPGDELLFNIVSANLFPENTIIFLSANLTGFSGYFGVRKSTNRIFPNPNAQISRRLFTQIPFDCGPPAPVQFDIIRLRIRNSSSGVPIYDYPNGPTNTLMLLKGQSYFYQINHYGLEIHSFLKE